MGALREKSRSLTPLKGAGFGMTVVMPQEESKKGKEVTLIVSLYVSSVCMSWVVTTSGLSNAELLEILRTWGAAMLRPYNYVCRLFVLEQWGAVGDVISNLRGCLAV
jgi:hypothetical protein